ncbi:MAG TPA: FAD:protein FMN transferase [Draconibacterium sp.]|nr:FAD:protein FMN transferase [Draconibacterium sp.]
MNQRKLLFLGLIFILQACNTDTSKYIANNGTIYGTYYNIKYESPKGDDLQVVIDEELQRLSHIFSHYDKEATITKINNNTLVELEPEFVTCFSKALEISEITNGAFDITAGPLINAWGFGPEDRQNMTDEKVDSLKQICGYEKISLEDGKVLKDNPQMTLNMSAIAKGYTCDLIGELLQKKGCQNYMVDIGGEVAAKGVNDKDKVWTIGIREPIENPFENELSAAIILDNHAMATSGNYLNFYEEDGKKYAHTIDPISGYPVQHSLLSASVVADDCMTADAFATAFMVLGKDAGIEIARQVPGMEIYFIYADSNGENQVYMSEGFGEMLRK